MRGNQGAAYDSDHGDSHPFNVFGPVYEAKFRKMPDAIHKIQNAKKGKMHVCIWA